jgi:hypothetical protein
MPLIRFLGELINPETADPRRNIHKRRHSFTGSRILVRVATKDYFGTFTDSRCHDFEFLKREILAFIH